jgi:translation elongation factor EF-Ts
LFKPFDIGKQIAQHIVGMKPSFLGELMPDVNSNASSTDSLKIDESETRLLYQEFLMKPNTRVLDFLREHNATVNEYVRFETGETIDTETNVN